jgi:DNA-binding IclR family transcriptional regulator
MTEASSLTVTGPHDSKLRRGLQLLEELALEPQSASELARTLGVNRSTTLRLLAELEQSQYVTRDAVTKKYSSRVERIHRLLARHDAQADWLAAVNPVLASLRDEFGEATVQAVPANGAMVYLAFFPSTHRVAVREHIGAVRPMYCSGLGRAYLSALDASPFDHELGRLAYTGGTAQAPQGPLELRRKVEETRAKGFATDIEETFDDVACVAAPTRVAGMLVGAAGVSGPASRLPLDRLNQIGQTLVERLSDIEIA